MQENRVNGESCLDISFYRGDDGGGAMTADAGMTENGAFNCTRETVPGKTSCRSDTLGTYAVIPASSGNPAAHGKACPQ